MQTEADIEWRISVAYQQFFPVLQELVSLCHTIKIHVQTNISEGRGYKQLFLSLSWPNVDITSQNWNKQDQKGSVN